MFSKIVSFAGMVSVGSAHMLMTNPIPFPGINNSPLDAGGADFPCKAVPYNADGITNSYEQGSVQQLKFQGTAVHGGGSCQVSVTTDLAPTANSVWKVIKSIEGGCPARDTPGNLPGNSAELEAPFAYDFTIPADLAAGEYVLAWSWLNRIGNREFYMNCAPITVTGSGGSDGFLDTLPDMTVANLASVNQCATKENFDYRFANPGNEVEEGNTAANEFETLDAVCVVGGGSGGSAPPTLPDDGAGDAPVVENPQTPPPAQEPQTPPPADAPAGGFAAGEACSAEGMFNCIGGTSFQQCASGAWSQAQPVAAGTTCTPGQSADLGISKRNTRRGRMAPIRV